MSIKATDLVSVDKNTGLICPKSSAKILLADGSLSDVPPNSFVHPQTGHVLPIQGNVAYDPVTSRLVFVVDSATGKSYLPFYEEVILLP